MTVFAKKGTKSLADIDFSARADDVTVLELGVPLVLFFDCLPLGNSARKVDSAKAGALAFVER